MNETSVKIPISAHWDHELSYEQIKEKALFAYYAKRERYPVKIVTEEKKMHDGTTHIRGYAIGTHRDGIIIANQFSAPKHVIDARSLTKDGIDELVDRFLTESEWR